MGIASSSPKVGRHAPRHARKRSAQASIPWSVLEGGMTFGTEIARSHRACETRLENLFYRTAYQTALRLDNARPEHRLIHPRRGSSNMER